MTDQQEAKRPQIPGILKFSEIVGLEISRFVTKSLGRNIDTTLSCVASEFVEKFIRMMVEQELKKSQTK